MNTKTRSVLPLKERMDEYLQKRKSRDLRAFKNGVQNVKEHLNDTALSTDDLTSPNGDNIEEDRIASHPLGFSHDLTKPAEAVTQLSTIGVNVQKDSPLFDPETINVSQNHAKPADADTVAELSAVYTQEAPRLFEEKNGVAQSSETMDVSQNRTKPADAKAVAELSTDEINIQDNPTLFEEKRDDNQSSETKDVSQNHAKPADAETVAELSAAYTQEAPRLLEEKHDVAQSSETMDVSQNHAKPADTETVAELSAVYTQEAPRLFEEKHDVAQSSETMDVSQNRMKPADAETVAQLSTDDVNIQDNLTLCEERCDNAQSPETMDVSQDHAISVGLAPILVDSDVGEVESDMDGRRRTTTTKESLSPLPSISDILMELDTYTKEKTCDSSDNCCPTSEEEKEQTYDSSDNYSPTLEEEKEFQDEMAFNSYNLGAEETVKMQEVDTFPVSIKRPIVRDPSVKPAPTIFELAKAASTSNVKIQQHKSKKRRPKVVDLEERVPETESESECDEQSDIINIPGISEVIVPESDSESAPESMHEDDVVRDILNKDIYIRSVKKSFTTKAGKMKKTNRVYNSRHACPFCKLLPTNWSHHVETHREEEEVQELLRLSPKQSDTTEEAKEKAAKRKEQMDLMRRNADHKHNMAVISEGKGEIILGRRPKNDSFALNNYGPCPYCYEWLKQSIIVRHQKWCPVGGGEKESKGVLLTQSAVLAGHISHVASKKLTEEVLTIMLHDEIGTIARSDPLILSTGNQWLIKNYGNQLKRAQYTSSVMRLNARLLKYIRQEKKDGSLTMTDCLKPENFDVVVQATLKCASLDMDDVEDLASPSNAIRLGFEIKRLVAAKKGFAIRAGSHEARQECKDFLDLMASEWDTSVTKHAQRSLQSRMHKKKEELPRPSDIKKLACYISKKLSSIDWTDSSKENYRYVAQLAQAKLISYNRRRSGEVQAILLESYHARIQGVSELDESMSKDLTEFEKYLLTSQEVMQTRGKRAKRVPVIVPQELQQPLAFLSRQSIRKSIGIHEENKFLFAAPGSKVAYIRGYESLSKIASEAELVAPQQITSVQLRKYMATVSQVINLTDAQANWLYQHLGHTADVHGLHYRKRSSVLERVEIAKLCLLMDTNRTKQFVGKRLEDIQFDDIVYPLDKDNEVEVEGNEDQVEGNEDQVEGNEDEAEGNGDEAEGNGDEAKDNEDETDFNEEGEMGIYAVMDDDHFFGNFDEETEELEPKKRRKQVLKRDLWSDAENKEVQNIFQEFIKHRKCPGQKEVEAGMAISKKNKGLIWQKRRDAIIKKISYINNKWKYKKASKKQM